ncbi:alpha/beta fold hydrolase [Rhodococcus sp. NPDC057529]|uniref:alpha/beta fold hydrolase n=1 Tax=Rhodococcus sp. NPDC057529 TaxID=3346158 RepID=UPI0036731215
MAEIRIENLTVENGLTFRTRQAGPLDGEPVLLLHGFPTTSAIWEGVLSALGDRGYRAVAPDQRGYSPSARPVGFKSYRYTDIATDVVRCADALNFDRFHLVGHDFGAIAGWASLGLLGARVRSWSALAVPHVRAFGTAIREDPDQRAMSGYVHRLRSQTGVDELVEEWSRDDFRELRADWSVNTPEPMYADFASVLTQPGALEAAYNWYLGTDGISPTDDELDFADVSVPTLCMWGNADPFVSRSSCEAAAKMMTGPYRFIELKAGHWLQIDAPDRVTSEILTHVQEWRI